VNRSLTLARPIPSGLPLVVKGPSGEVELSSLPNLNLDMLLTLATSGAVRAWDPSPAGGIHGVQVRVAPCGDQEVVFAVLQDRLVEWDFEGDGTREVDESFVEFTLYDPKSSVEPFRKLSVDVTNKAVTLEIGVPYASAGYSIDVVSNDGMSDANLEDEQLPLIDLVQWHLGRELWTSEKRP
jgi:hypothetical protein